MSLSMVKKFSLEGLAEGWTADCHLMYNAVKYGELKALQDLNIADQDIAKATDTIVTFAQDHFVSGKGLIEQAGAAVMGELTKADVAELPIDTIGKLFQEMTGQATDPKDTAPTTK